MLIVILVAAAVMFLPPAILYCLSFTSLVSIEFTSFWKLAFFCWLAICLSNLFKRFLWKSLSREIFTFGMALVFANCLAVHVADRIVSSVSAKPETIFGLAIALTLGTVIEKVFATRIAKETD